MSTTGASVLTGIILGDRIGYVSSESEDIVFDGWEVWAARCIGGRVVPDGAAPELEVGDVDVIRR